MTEQIDLRSFFNERFPKDASDVLIEAGRLAEDRKQGAVVVGGVVRDFLLKWPTIDADLMLEPPAEPLVKDLEKKFNARLVSHPRFFTFTLHLPSQNKVDVVTAREETYAKPAALPDVKPSSIEKDLKRRDFSLNAVAAFLHPKRFGELLDPFNGRADMKEKRIRALHAKSFEDDPTRVFRAARFAGRFGFSIDAATLGWIKDALEDRGPARLSPARLRHEFEILLKEKDPVPALDMLSRWNALSFIQPEWALKPKHVHLADVGGDLGPDERLKARLIAWFAVWGKPEAERMMTALAFERDVKKEVLGKL